MYQKITILFSSLRNQETYHYLVKMIYMIRLELTKTFKICLQTTLSKIRLVFRFCFQYCILMI